MCRSRTAAECFPRRCHRIFRSVYNRCHGREFIFRLEYVYLMYDDAWLILFGAAIGICGGFLAQYVHTKMWLKEDVKKTKSLLRSELNGIYRTLKFEEETFSKLLRHPRNEFDAVCDQHMPIADAIGTFDMVRLRFLAWETVISSGVLFKLDEKDMKIIQTAQQNIRDHDRDLDNLGKRLEEVFNTTLQRFSYSELRSGDTDLLKPYFEKCRNVVGRTLRVFEDLDMLDWFDHTKIPKKDHDISRYGNFSIQV